MSASEITDILNQADFLVRSKQYQSAHQLLDHCKDTLQHDHRLYLKRGTIYFRQSQYDQAITCFQKALTIEPRSEDALYSLSIALVDIGHYDEASELLSRNITEKSGTVESSQIELANQHMLLAEKYLASGFVFESIQESQKAQRLDPDSVELSVNLAKTYIKAKRFDSAISTLTLILERADAQNSSEIYALLGVSYFFSQDHLSARENFLKSLEIDDSNRTSKAFLRLCFQ